MNKDTIQNIFIGILLGGVLLLAGGVYFLAMQVQTATQGINRIEQNVTESMQKMDNAFRCIESGGQYEAGQCECGSDYFLENGSCMGQDGLTKRQLEEIKTGQEKIIRNEIKTYTTWELLFDYPKNWFAEQYDDEFVSGQKNVRITSSPGTLEGTASWFQTISAEFENGFLADMRRLSLDQGGFPEAPTRYPNIVKDVGDCDALSCPTEQYIFRGRAGNYLIRFKYTDASTAANVDLILSSLKEK